MRYILFGMLGGLIAFNLIDAGKPKASVDQCFSKDDVMKYIDDNKFQLVHYWPGDNEYGAFVKVQHGKKVVVLATIVDGIIRCN